MRTQNILFLTLLFSTCLSELCNPNDKRTLLQIKRAFNNPQSLASWDPQTDCCNWYYVTCDDTTDSHRINYLFVGGDLAGQIPPQIGDLSYLESIDIGNSRNLTGPIPQAISTLKHLTRLGITGTGISGRIPEFIGELKKLNAKTLSDNRLSGPIPNSIFALPVLQVLRLDENKLTGPIPDTFGNFNAELFYLYLGRNNLSGKIPASMGKKKIGFVDLSSNRLEGDATMLFGPGKTLSGVNLSRNLFEFDFSKVVFQESLSYLDVSHNKIFGSLLPSLAKLSLDSLNVSYNRLCGRIPVGRLLQTKFGVTEYFHNRCLCGAPLPECT